MPVNDIISDSLQTAKHVAVLSAY